MAAPRRWMSTDAMTYESIQSRVMDVCKAFDKIPSDKVKRLLFFW